MKIGINASFARKANTGIGQLTLNFLRKISESKNNEIEFFLYLEEDIDLKLPDNPASSAGKFQKRVVLPLWKRDDLIRAMWREKWTLPRAIKKDKCDVFLSLYQSATILPKNIKHIMIVHDVIPILFPEYLNNSRKRKYQCLVEKAINKADKIIAVSSRTEKDLIQYLGIAPDKISVDYIDIDEIYKEKVSEEKSQAVMKKYDINPGYIYSGGGLEIRKNMEGLIRAYKLLWERNTHEHFLEHFPQLVISGKLMPQLAPLITDAEKLVKELNLTQRVKLLDFVPQEDLPALYKNAVLFVYPSLYEGFGMPVLEAMNQGVPVIASKCSSIPEVGRDGILYFDPQNRGDVVMVMKNILTNKNLRDTIAERGKERAKYFSWDKFTEKIFHIIEEL